MVAGGGQGGGKVTGPGGLPDLPGRRIDIKKSATEPLAPQKNKQAETRKQNKVFKQAAPSQDNLAANKEGTQKSNEKNKAESQQGKNPDSGSKAGQKREYEIKNVDVRAFLDAEQQTGKKPGKPRKPKAKPPSMNLRTKLAKKGAINPQEHQGVIPARLKGSKDINPMKQLEVAAEMFGAPEEDPNLISQYAKKLLSGETGEKGRKSIASMLGLDESLADLDKNEIMRMLNQAMQSPELADEIKSVLAEALGLLNQPESNALKPLLLLFMPFPFNFELKDIDEEFYKDDEELLDEEWEEDESEDSEEENEEEVEEYDVEANISVKTLNYGKVHFHLTHDNINNKYKLSIKAGEEARDLCVAIEANMELAVMGSDFLQDQLREWHDNVLATTEYRELIIDSGGKLNSGFLKACNSILETIIDSDEGDYSQDLEADYSVLE